MVRFVTPRSVAILQALFVTFLWATSWVFIKVGLADIPALTFAGLRYTLGFLCLLPLMFRSANLATLRQLGRWEWMRLALLGFVYYSLTQGAQFFGLFFLPAVTVSLLLNFTTISVAALGMLFLDERPALLQWAGMGLAFLGAWVYFFPAALPMDQVTGLMIVAGGVLTNALSAILGRSINRESTIPAQVVTTVSMGIGAVILLAAGIGWQGWPSLSHSSWAIILWLALVNTAFAFTVWNRTLRILSAVESSVINSTMLVQIAVLALILLGEPLTWKQATGMGIVALGTLIVQLNPTGRVREISGKRDQVRR
ncbi:MAG: EamA family transporter [Chloroflexi bacterium]|nr:EamA family transporter [Chloroflexota bacterium]